MQDIKHKVCIIGAGPCGLVAARHLSESPDTQVTVFEADSKVGGMWNLDERNEVEPQHHDSKAQDAYYQFNGYFHGSIYPHLQANLPYQLMSFKDLSHEDIEHNLPSFIKHSQHQKYLNAYADKFDLRKYIQLNTLVKSVRLHKNLSSEEQSHVLHPRKFFVETARTTESGHTYTTCHSFDYVVVANGHCSKPNNQEIKGIENFKGKVFNSKDFREPDAEYLKEKKVIVVGSGFSAIDMLPQLLENPYVNTQDVAKLIMVGSRVGFMAKGQDFSKYIEQGKLSFVSAGIEEIIDEKTVKCTDGSLHEADTIILCTGYLFDFPFLDLEKDKFVDFNPKYWRGLFLGPVYKRFICIREPNLFFLGLISDSPIVNYCHEMQVLVIKYLIEGKIKLPSTNEMVQSFLGDLDLLRYPTHATPKLLYNFKLFRESIDIPYWRDLKEWVGPVHPGDKEKGKRFEEMALRVHKEVAEWLMSGNFINYKKQNFRRLFDENLKNSFEFL